MPKKKKQKDQRIKYLLETSAQIVRLTPNPKANEVNKFTLIGRAYTSFFVLYEFKTGLLKNIIEYYFLVKITKTPQEAMSIWSNKFGKRELKNKILLEAKMGQLFDSIKTKDKAGYLRQIKAVIFDLITNFDTGLNSTVGDFGSDEIVKAKLFTEADYQAFINIYNSRKTIPMQKFWKRHINELKAIVNETNLMSKSDGLKKILKCLSQINESIANADKHNTNKGVGDAVIVVDMPPTMKLLSLDQSFGTLCPILDKECKIIS